MTRPLRAWAARSASKALPNGGYTYSASPSVRNSTARPYCNSGYTLSTNATVSATAGAALTRAWCPTPVGSVKALRLCDHWRPAQ